MPDPAAVAAEYLELERRFNRAGGLGADRSCERLATIEQAHFSDFAREVLRRGGEITRLTDSLDQEQVRNRNNVVNADMERRDLKATIRGLRTALGYFTDSIDLQARVNWQRLLHDENCTDCDAGTDDDDTPEGERLCKCDGPHKIAVVRAAKPELENQT